MPRGVVVTRAREARCLPNHIKHGFERLLWRHRSLGENVGKHKRPSVE